MKRLKRILTALLLVLAGLPAWGASTINTTQPPPSGPLNSAPIRANFIAAAADIVNLQGMFAGTAAPSNPVRFQLWANTGATPYEVKIWDGGAWATYGSLNPSSHVFLIASGGTAAGSNSQLQYNNLGALAGITGATTNGTFVALMSPVLVTPTLGVATATSLNKVVITAPATTATLTLANNKTITFSNTLTFSGTDTAVIALGGGGTVAYTSNSLSAFAATTSAQLAGVISDETGSGTLVFGTGPTFLANGSNLIAAFSKSGTRTWNWSYASTALAPDANNNTLNLVSDRGAGLTLYVTDYGFLSMGNLHTQFANLTCNALISTTLCADSGPAVRIYGDIVAGDYLYFGATSAAGVEVMQVGTRLSGAYPSKTLIGAGEIGFTTDVTGSASIDLHPDSACANCTPAGTLRLRAHGSVGGANSNQIEFYTRNGVSTEARRWYVVSAGSLIPDADNTYDLGSSSSRVANVYAVSLQTATVAATGPQARPGGRLTLTSGTPVMVADATAQTTVYYTPFQTDLIPVYDGTRFTGYQFAELSVAMASNAAWTSGSVYDWFVARDSGTTRLCSGPAWSSTSARGTGAGTTQLTLTSGIYLNTVSMTCRYATGSTFTAGALTATYVGTTYMTGNGATGMTFLPSRASGGSANILGVYNAYNRVELTSREGDSTATWTYQTATWRAANGNTNNSIRWVDGLAQSYFSGSYGAFTAAAATGAGYANGCALGWSSGAPDYYGIVNPNQGETLYGTCNGPSSLGLNTVTALEQPFNATGTNTISGGAAMSLSVRVSM